VKSNIGEGSRVIVILVGAQSDKVEKRQVSKEMVDEFVEANKIDYAIETSAKNNENVDELFMICARLLYDRFKEDVVEKNLNI